MNISMRSKGFTLLEVLMSLIILSISLLALAGLMTMTTRNNSFGSHVTEAATFAQDKLEELRVVPWGNIVSGTDPTPIVGCTGITYARNWNVEPTDPPMENLRKITITINWNDRIDHSITILSVICK